MSNLAANRQRLATLVAVAASAPEPRDKLDELLAATSRAKTDLEVQAREVDRLRHSIEDYLTGELIADLPQQEQDVMRSELERDSRLIEQMRKLLLVTSRQIASLSAKEDRWDEVYRLYKAVVGNDKANARLRQLLTEELAGWNVDLVASQPALGNPGQNNSFGPGVSPLDETSKGKSWTNSLGMVFVRIPGTQVLFSIWETRIQDYDAYAGGLSSSTPPGMLVFGKGKWTKRQDADWQHPGFDQGPTFPVVGVSWEEAGGFCEWLTLRERRNGLLANAMYSLPTDVEWSLAVGLKQELGNSPRDRAERIKSIYPWGTTWPPPRGAGNFAGSEMVSDSPVGGTIENYRDPYVRTAPVGSFAPGLYGLFDMTGNVWQWCFDDYDRSLPNMKVIRGASWADSAQNTLLSSNRGAAPAGQRRDCIGFRCTIRLDGSAVAPIPAGE